MLARVILICASLFGSGICNAAVARAEDGTAEQRQRAADARVLTRCTENDGGEMCIGRVADPCLKRAKDGGSRTQCYGRERSAWESLVQGYAERSLTNLDDAQKAAHHEAHRAWATYKDKTCTYIATFVDGTMAYPWVAACEMKETARRAFYLRRLVDYAEGN